MADWKLKIDVERPDVKGAQVALQKLFKELDRIDKMAKKADKTIEKAVKVLDIANRNKIKVILAVRPR